RKLEPAELLAFAEAGKYQLTADFVRQVSAKGDECYAMLDGDILAAYGWYSRNRTVLDNEDLMLRFDSSYIYMYKGFTLDRYRGQRLHAIGMTRALAEYKTQGFCGLVSYVESNNFDSLKSCYRMGYRNCGRIHILRVN